MMMKVDMDTGKQVNLQFCILQVSAFTFGSPCVKNRHLLKIILFFFSVHKSTKISFSFIPSTPHLPTSSLLPSSFILAFILSTTITLPKHSLNSLLSFTLSFRCLIIYRNIQRKKNISLIQFHASHILSL